MTFGTLCLLRPVQSFGRIVSYQWSTSKSGSMLKGHMYAAKLDTTFVRKRLPLSPDDAPCRVIVTSPFATDKTAYSLAKIAAAKADYIIEKEKIVQTMQFWRDIGNNVMEDIEFDQEVYEELSNLPKNVDGNRYAAAVFLDGDEVEEESNSVGDDKGVSEEVIDGTGGPSLLRSNEELETAVFTSATVTIGATDVKEQNVHERVLEVLKGINNITPPISSSTYAVRPRQEFESDSSVYHLEKRYPDLFPAGRAGFDEERTVPMSKDSVLRRLLNLSTRQFQKPDFILPCCDLVTKNAMKRQAFVRAKLPSRRLNADGSTPISRGEAFGRVSPGDMQLVADYKIACFNASKKGKYIYLIYYDV